MGYPPAREPNLQTLGEPLLEGLFVPGLAAGTEIPGWEELYFRIWIENGVLRGHTILVAEVAVNASQRLEELERRSRGAVPCRELYQQAGYFWYEREFSEADTPKLIEIVQKVSKLAFRYAPQKLCVHCPTLTLSASGDFLSVPSVYFDGQVSGELLQWALEIWELGTARAEEEFLRSRKPPR